MVSSDGSTTTESFARFVLEASYEDLGSDVVHAVRRSVLDWIGVAIAGRPHEATRSAVRARRALGGPGVNVVFGEVDRTDLSGAVLLNGIMSHVLDWDDAVYPTRLHPTGALLPGLLACGEVTGATGRDLIVGHAVGFELTRRIGDATYPDLGDRRWHSTGIAGSAAAGAAVGRLLQLDVERMSWAIGLGAGMAAGTLAALGSSAKSLIPGHAAVAGITAAYLAREGFTSHPDMLGRSGRFLDLYADEPDYDGLLEGLGTRWAVLENGFKPYPCGMVAHAAIDAVRDLRRRAPAGAALKALRLRVSPETLSMMGNPEPRTGLQGKFSVRYEAAVAWVEGDVTPAAFEDAAVRREDYQAALARTGVEADERIAQQEAHAEVETFDGWQAAVHVPFARGTVQRPMTDEDLHEKFLTACRLGGYDRAEELAGMIAHLEDVTAADLTAMLAGPWNPVG